MLNLSVPVTNSFDVKDNQLCSKLKICFSNVDTLSNKVAELEAFLATEKPVIMGLCEIFPKFSYDKTNIADLKFDDYDLLSPGTHGDRGVAILTHKSLKATSVNRLNTIKFKENVWCEIVLNGNDKLLIGMIYRSPTSSGDNNLLLNELINSAVKLKYSHFLLMGDFNYRNINWMSCESNSAVNHPATQFVECTKSNYIYQHIKEPTRYRDGQNPSCLDLVLTNEDSMISQESININPPLGKSDHSIVSFEYVCYYEEEDTSEEKFQYFKGNYANLRETLSGINWEEKLKNKTVEQMWDVFKNCLLEEISNNIPKKSMKNKFMKSPLWMDKNAKLAVIKKDRAWKKYKYSRSLLNYNNYSSVRNNCTSTVRQSKRSYEMKIATESNVNNKSFWKYVNSKRKTRDGIGDLKKDDDTLVTDNIDKADVLNNFFSSVFVKSDDFDEDRLENDIGSRLDDINITLEEVEKVLNGLKPDKSPGPDNLHPKVLYESRKEICVPLFMIFNQSIQEGNIPNDWRKAIVVPIFKKGSKKEPSNYRPVSLTSVVCKLCESLIRKNVMNYMLQNHLFSDNQYGFRPGRSCVIQLLEILDEWTKLLDIGNPVEIVYLDFSKAFDTVSHERLLFKLYKLGIRGSVLSWIKNFLIDREQCVRVGTNISSWSKVISGVPQGSGLGPVLFLCFINDLPNVVDGMVKIFADDTKLYTVSKEENCEALQKDLDNLCDWSDKWKLSFNSKKCKVLHVGNNNPHYRYTMTDSDGYHSYIESVDSEKDLGVTFDTKLNFDVHITNIVNKAQRNLGIIHRSFEYMDKPMLLTLYKSIVRPVLEYGSCVWSPHLSKDIKRIEGIQRRATKLIPDLEELPYIDRMKSLGLPTLEYRRDRADMIQIYKSIHNLDELKWDNMFSLSTGGLRGHNLKFIKMKSHNNIRFNTFSQRSVNLWNKLTCETVNASSINVFKSLLNKEDWNDKKFHPS